MGEFKLKQGVEVKYDSENKVYSFPKSDLKSHKKLTSRAFACIIGKNKWESVGKSILERFRLNKKDIIDPYYGVRGDLAELMVYDFLKAHYKKTKEVDLGLVTWDKNDISYDNFSTNKQFGGMIDIAIKTPSEYRAVVEVKSKSMKDLDKIKESKGNPEEVMQGIFLSYLSKVDKCLMIYVFFTEEQEQNIKRILRLEKDKSKSREIAQKVISELRYNYEYFKIVPIRHKVSTYAMPKLTEEAYAKLESVRENSCISEEFFSINENQYLKKIATGQEPTPF